MFNQSTSQHQFLCHKNSSSWTRVKTLEAEFSYIYSKSKGLQDGEGQIRNQQPREADKSVGKQARIKVQSNRQRSRNTVKTNPEKCNVRHTRYDDKPADWGGGTKTNAESIYLGSCKSELGMTSQPTLPCSSTRSRKTQMDRQVYHWIPVDNSALRGILHIQATFHR